MSSRLHDKWHRHNHHTYGSDIEPDAGHDPIASPKDPFQGDFYISGTLSACAPLSAAAGFFDSANTGIITSGIDLGMYALGLSGITTFASASTTTNNISGDINQAGLYCFGFASDPGPYVSIEWVRGFIPKALVCDGYADFRWPIYAQSVYTPYIYADEFRSNTVYTGLLTATEATFNTLTATTLTVTTIVASTTSTVSTTVSSLSTNTLSANDIYSGYIHMPAHGTVALTLSASITIPQNTWTLVPMNSARWDPYSYFTGFGTVKPNVNSVCLCELDMIAHPLSGTSLGIVAGVTTNTTMSAVTANPDNLPKVFYGNWFDNNGVTFTSSAGASGVSIKGTTFVDVNGTSDEIGVYIYNADGQSIVDYAKLRVVVLGMSM